MSKQITWKEVAKNAENNWVVIENQVYDPTPFLENHPGGSAVIRNKAGKDVSRFFKDMGHSQKARDILKTLKVGDIAKDSQPEDWQKDKDMQLVYKSVILFFLAILFVYWNWK